MRALRPSLPTLLVTAVLAVVIGGAWLEVRNYQAVRDGALTALRYRAATLAESTASAFHVADTALRSVVAERSTHLNGALTHPAETREHLRVLVDALPQVSGLAVVDPTGRIVTTTADGGAGADGSAEVFVDDRDYFRWFSVGPGAENPGLAPFVGQPARSRLNGAWFLGMSRPVRVADGQFAGVALAVFSLDWFDSINDASILPPDTALVLATQQDTVIDAVLPGREATRGGVGRPLELVLPGLGLDGLRRRAVEAGGPVVSEVPGGIAAVAPLPGLPLNIVLFRPWQTVLTVWQRQLVSDVGLMVLALVTLLSMAVPLVRALRDRDRLFQLSPDPVCVCDSDGRILRANQAWSRVLGIAPESLVGRLHADLVDADDVEVVRRAEARLRGGERIEDLAVRYPRRDGGDAWLSWSAVAEGERLYVQARDITHRRQAEEALRTSEQRFRDVAEAASEFIWEVDGAGCVAYVSRRVRSVLGWAPDEVRGKPLADLLNEDGGARLRAALRRGAPFVVEVAAPRGEGLAWLRLSGQPTLPGSANGSLVEPGGPQPLGYRGAAQDITESRHARQALLDSEARYRGIVNTVVDAIVTIDERGIIQSVNPAAELLFGYSAREMINHNVSMLTPDSIRSEHDGFIRNYIRTGVPRVIGAGREVEGRRKDGTLVPIELGLSEVFLGSQRFFIGACRDVSERKRVERLKDEFVATVSHELRTPLTSIRGSLGLMAGGAMGALPTKVSGLVDVALANCERLTRLVDDILDIERIEGSLLRFDMRPVDLWAVARRAVDDLRPVIAAVQVTVEMDGDGDDDRDGDGNGRAIVRGDFDRLLQAVSNLVSNAIKFSPSGGTITVRIEEEDGSVRLSVRDAGPGIPEAFHARVFDRFSQADGSTTRGQGGSGLGLAIVRAIILRHNGLIGFTTSTEPPTGTTFTMRLPRATGDFAREGAGSDRSGAVERSSMGGRG